MTLEEEIQGHFDENGKRFACRENFEESRNVWWCNNILDIDVKQQFVWYGNFRLEDHEVVLDLSQNLFVG